MGFPERLQFLMLEGARDEFKQKGKTADIFSAAVETFHKEGAMNREKKLGMGLEALLTASASESSQATTDEGINVESIHPNPYQPRFSFDEDDIHILAESIKRDGILQPVVLRRVNGSYELIAGERRWRAAKLAGLTSIPSIIRQADDRAMLRWALVENVQRKDLNPIEKARAFRRLMDSQALSQDEVADLVGLQRSTVANFLRLLELPVEIQEAVSRGTISMGHARALLAARNAGEMLKLLRRIIEDDLSVREVERMSSLRTSPSPPAQPKVPHVEDLERRFSDYFGTRVFIRFRKRGARMIVDFFSNEQFNSLLTKMGI